MTNRTHGRDAPAACEPAGEPGCDADPRSSTPIHRGAAGQATIGRCCRARRTWSPTSPGTRTPTRSGSSTAGAAAGSGRSTPPPHIDWPQQSRLIEIMDNRDGTLSIFGTMLDTAAPQAAPAPGRPRASRPELGSLSRARSPSTTRSGRAGAGRERPRDKRGGRRTATSSCWSATRARTSRRWIPAGRRLRPGRGDPRRAHRHRRRLADDAAAADRDRYAAGRGDRYRHRLRRADEDRRRCSTSAAARSISASQVARVRQRPGLAGRGRAGGGAALAARQRAACGASQPRSRSRRS